jgi:hypothetical protein
MARLVALIACMAGAAAWSACSLIVTADPEGDGSVDDGAEELAEAAAEGEGEAQEDAPPEDIPQDELPLPPPGWIECHDSGGSSVWVMLMPESMSHDTWSLVEQDCLAAIDAQDYFNALKASHGFTEGLARIADASVLACLEYVVRSNQDACLNPDSENDTCFYHVGLVQEAAGAEPSGGWHWTGYRDGGMSPENLGILDADHVSGIEDDFDDTCCSGTLPDSDCGLLKVRRLSDSWSTWFIDYRCAGACAAFQGICMAAFTDVP